MKNVNNINDIIIKCHDLLFKKKKTEQMTENVK